MPQSAQTCCQVPPCACASRQHVPPRHSRTAQRLPAHSNHVPKRCLQAWTYIEALLHTTPRLLQHLTSTAAQAKGSGGAAGARARPQHSTGRRPAARPRPPGKRPGPDSGAAADPRSPLLARVAGRKSVLLELQRLAEAGVPSATAAPPKPFLAALEDLAKVSNPKAPA